MNVLIKYDYEKLYNEYKNNEIHNCYKINKLLLKFYGLTIFYYVLKIYM